MAEIFGKYNINADISAIVNNYAFTNANRNAELQASADTMISFYCAEINRPIQRNVSFNPNAVLKVRRARIVTPGAPGLQSNRLPAANILLIAKNANDTTADNLGSITLSFMQFNEWEDFNMDFLQVGATGIDFYFMLDSTYSKLNVDDYNLQSAYEGETFKATLQLEVDTAGLVGAGGVII